MGKKYIENIRNTYLAERKSIFDELKAEGCCAKIDNISAASYERFKYLFYLAIKDAYTAYLDGRDLQPEHGDRYSETGEYWGEIGNTFIPYSRVFDTIHPLT